uniref:Uncharacterized protein n=1 Tax=Glossina pallidipes TaxID=7398 RepID=A0A1A9ZTP7_GLOPL
MKNEKVKQNTENSAKTRYNPLQFKRMSIIGVKKQNKGCPRAILTSFFTCTQFVVQPFFWLIVQASITSTVSLRVFALRPQPQDEAKEQTSQNLIRPRRLNKVHESSDKQFSARINARGASGDFYEDSLRDFRRDSQIVLSGYVWLKGF